MQLKDPDESFDIKVLVAEDNPINQKVAQRMLERLGCQVVMAATGREAVETIAAASCDLIFMDCMMPEMDGYEATRTIRTREQEVGGRIPIIAMTAGALDGDREKCLAAGMDDFVTKPVTYGEIAGVLRRWAGQVGSRP